MRLFILDVLAHPSERGIFYAQQSLGECRALGSMTDATTRVQPPFDAATEVDHSRKIAVFDWWKSRCSELGEAERTALGEQLIEKSKGFGSNLSQMGQRLSAARRDNDEGARRKTLELLMQDADPYTFNSVGMALGLYGDLSGLGLSFVYQGSAYSLKQDPDIVFAVGLLPCGLGVRCDEKEGLTGLHCLAGGACYASRFDALANEELKGNPERYARVMALYEKLVVSVQNKVVSDFMR